MQDSRVSASIATNSSVTRDGSTIVVEQERIAAGKDHLADRRVGRNRLQRLLQAGRGRPALGIGKLPPEAVAAVDGAGSGGEHERPSGVFPDESRRGERRPLGERVGREAGDTTEFPPARQHLREQRVGGITPPDAPQKGPRDQQAEAARGSPRLLGQRVIQPEQPAEFEGIPNRFGQLPLPAAAPGRCRWGAAACDRGGCGRLRWCGGRRHGFTPGTGSGWSPTGGGPANRAGR
jgi:hypothetical protein